MNGKVIKETFKKIGRCAWEFIKGSFPAGIMYCCAGTILMMLTLNSETLHWTSKDVTWTVVCILGAAVYNALIAWANGGSQYEMLVSGNIKRMSEGQLDGGYKMSSHKEVKEYRAWKGFVVGAVTALIALNIKLSMLFTAESARMTGAYAAPAGVTLLLTCKTDD